MFFMKKLTINQRQKIANIIFDMVEEWKTHPFKINNGLCKEFSLSLQKKIDNLNLGLETETYWAEELYPNFEKGYEDLAGFHCFLKVNNYFFDAEEPYGVTDFRHLPCITRYFRNKAL